MLCFLYQAVDTILILYVDINTILILYVDFNNVLILYVDINDILIVYVYINIQKKNRRPTLPTCGLYDRPMFLLTPFPGINKIKKESSVDNVTYIIPHMQNIQ